MSTEGRRLPIVSMMVAGVTILTVVAASAQATSTSSQADDCGFSFFAPSPSNCVHIETTVAFGPCAPSGPGHKCQVQVHSNVTFYDWVTPGEADVSLTGSCQSGASTQWTLGGDAVHFSCSQSVFYASGQCDSEQGTVRIVYTTLGRSVDTGVTDSIETYPLDVYRVATTTCAP